MPGRGPSASGVPLRVVRLDGEGLAVTDDYSESRINVAVDAGRVTKVTGLF